MGKAGYTASLIQTKQDRAISQAIQKLQRQEEGDLSEGIETSSYLLN
jgi:hypothetical protein